MIQLRVYGRLAALREIGQALEDMGAVSAAGLSPAVRGGHGVLTGVVRRDAADEVLHLLGRRGVSEHDVALVQTDDVGPIHPGGEPTGSLIWADMIGQANRNARPVARYLAFMVVAGIIAGYGVITVNPTLIVGAMAVSPDTLPVTAACVGLVERHPRLVLRALLTLAIGLAATGLAALVLPLLLSAQARLPSGFLESSTLTGLVRIGVGTIGVALAAGVAAMLALETRASSAVGVAISVTTIPAAAYFGVAAGVGDLDRAWGALAVLGVNVAMLLLSGTLTLLVQRRLRSRPPRADGRSASSRDGARTDDPGSEPA